MKKFVLGLFLLTTACATTHEKTVPVVQQVYCVTPDQLAEITHSKPASVGGTLTGDAQTDVIIEGKQVVLLNSYADGLVTVLSGCTGPSPSDA